MIAELPSVAFEYAILCDEVRREDNGKFIHIGVYANNILLGSFPSSLRLRLVTRMEPKKEEFPLGFRVRLGAETVMFFKGHVSSPLLEVDTSPTPEFIVEFPAPTTLEIDVTDEDFDFPEGDKAKWTPLFQIPVRQKAD